MSIADVFKNAALNGIKGTAGAVYPNATIAKNAISSVGNVLYNNPSNSAKTQLLNSGLAGASAGLNSGQKAATLSQPIRPATSTISNNNYGGGYSYTSPQTPDYGNGGYSGFSGGSVQDNTGGGNNYASNNNYIQPQPVAAQPQSNPYNDQLKALQDKINSLNDSFSNYLKPSDQELESQRQLDALTGEQRNLSASAALGLANIKAKPIALEFQTGQSRNLVDQANAQMQALGAQSEPLTTQLARLQSERKNSADLAKYQLENIKNQYGELESQSKPIEVGGNLVRLNQATGQYDTLFSPPSKSGGSDEGFTLGEGQTRFDAQGNLIASGAPKTPQEQYTNDIKEYNFAKSQGYGGSFTDYQQSKNNSGGGGSLPAAYREYQLTQSDPAFAKYLQGSKPQSPDQLKASGFADRLQTSDSIINNLNSTGSNNLGTISGSQFFPNAWKSSDRQKLEQAENDFAHAILRRESGAAISSQEFADTARQYFPQPGDTKEVLDQKAFNRLQSIKNLQREGGQQSPVNPQEIQDLRNHGYSDQQIQQFLGQRGFNQPLSMGGNGSGKIKIPQNSTLAYVNNNPGNLRFAGQTGATPGRGGFAKFSSPEAGYEALKNQIQIRVNQGKNLVSFISQYAPPSENDTNGYITTVSRQLGVSPNTPLSKIPLESLARVIAQHESSTKIV